MKNLSLNSMEVVAGGDDLWRCCLWTASKKCVDKEQQRYGALDVGVMTGEECSNVMRNPSASMKKHNLIGGGYFAVVDRVCHGAIHEDKCEPIEDTQYNVPL